MLTSPLQHRHPGRSDTTTPSTDLHTLVMMREETSLFELDEFGVSQPPPLLVEAEAEAEDASQNTTRKRRI
jgi:hypothetical protein